MKTNRILLILSILFLSSTSLLTEQGSYYWSAKQKHPLQEDRNYVIARVVEADMEAVKSRIQAANSVRTINRLRSPGVLFIEFTQNAPGLASLIRSNPEIMAAAYGMRLQGEGPPVFPTGEILLQPKEGNDIRGILNLIPGDYLSYEANKYNTYTIRIQDWQQVINLANKIYESGLVRYSHPNFIAAIEKYQVTPTDPLYAQQYYLNQGNNIDINAPQAW